MPQIVNDDLRQLDVMNFLNEATSRYSDAISFASGRPSEEFFNFKDAISKIPLFIDAFAASRKMNSEQAYRQLAQYGPTDGIICDLIAKQLENDSDICCSPDQVFVTSGCQEGIALCLATLRETEDDTLLVRNPTYIGITGAAKFCGMPIVPLFKERQVGLVASVLDAVLSLAAVGKRARVLYLTPDFDNPTGETLSLKDRLSLIDISSEHSITILEDNPYGLFRFDDASMIPTMYALDGSGHVVYLGTYSKTLYPTIRVGYIILPQRLLKRGLRAALCRRKSFGSLNTSQIGQAIVGGVLIAEEFTLSRRTAAATKFYLGNRNAMLDALRQGASNVDITLKFNNPSGGFFITVGSERIFLREQLEVCARQQGVVVMPLAFFSFDNSFDRSIRLAYSNVSKDVIEEGISRLLSFLSSSAYPEIHVG